jgi:BASS family bile acid:Na+ symporter
MASGLASAMGKLGTVGLASAIFIPWMNISGSILANYWRKRPVAESATGSLDRGTPGKPGNGKSLQNPLTSL